MVSASFFLLLIFTSAALCAAPLLATDPVTNVPSEEEVLQPKDSVEPKVSKDPNDVRFFFYGNPDDEEDRREIRIHNVISLVESGYNQSRPLILLLHGVLSTSLTNSDVQLVKNAYLRMNYEANIIMVDYGPLTESRLPIFLSPASFFVLLMGHGNTRVVATRVEEFLLFLMTYHMLSGPECVHIIGFSLGSHIAGNVGRRIWRSTGNKVKRITGLDPSPQTRLQHRLNPGDAEFVDVTLTSLGYLTKVWTEGTVQFYMNGGGPHQPNCPYFAPVTETYCSHIMAPFYYSKSITRKVPIIACPCAQPCKTEVTECAGGIVYGEDTDLTARGNYYVKIE